MLISLFGMLLITTVVEVAGNYDKDTSEVVGGSLSLGKFNSSIVELQTKSEGWMETFSTGGIWDIAGVVVTGIFGVVKFMIIFITTPFSLITDIMIDVFGIPSWVTSTLIGLLIIGVIFGIWRLIKIGD